MSGDERRGTDGGELPLDVEARFADIIAHFHDGDPAPPRVVDAGDGDGDAGTTASVLSARADGPTDRDDRRRAQDRADEHRGDERADDSADDPADGRSDPYDRTGHDGRTDLEHDAGADDAATDWAARYEQAAREELAAHEERTARREREARIAAEVDRAVDGPDTRYVPDEPPPIPRPADLPARLAWGAVLLGPVALVLFALLWRTAPPWLVGSVVTAVVAGFGYLVWRLPRTRDRDDGGDGAIV